MRNSHKKPISLPKVADVWGAAILFCLFLSFSVIMPTKHLFYPVVYLIWLHVGSALVAVQAPSASDFFVH